MGHNLQAIVARPEVLRALCERHPCARAVPLDQGFAMVPATGEVLDSLGASASGSAPAPVLDGFTYLDQRLERALCTLSRSGPLVYLETDYFGGAGSQAAAVFADGRTVLCGASDLPINHALRLLGAAPGGAHDEFEAVGLGRHRSTGEWEPD